MILPEHIYLFHVLFMLVLLPNESLYIVPHTIYVTWCCYTASPFRRVVFALNLQARTSEIRQGRIETARGMPFKQNIMPSKYNIFVCSEMCII